MCELDIYIFLWKTKIGSSYVGGAGIANLICGDSINIFNILNFFKIMCKLGFKA